MSWGGAHCSAEGGSRIGAVVTLSALVTLLGLVTLSGLCRLWDGGPPELRGSHRDGERGWVLPGVQCALTPETCSYLHLFISS